MNALRNQTSMFSVDYMVAEAIDFLREHEPPEGYYLGFSGGKDSIVIKKLAEMAGVKFSTYYSAVGIDPPELVKFIRRYHPEVEFLHPEMTMWEGIKKKCPPLARSRWCCDVLKKDPGKNIPLPHRIMGQRAEESARRASRGQIDIFKKQTTYKPIFKWTSWHIWEFIETLNLPYCELYDQGFDRIGCVVCPFLLGPSAGKKTRRQQSIERWPGMWKAYEHSCSVWFHSIMEKSGGKIKKQKHDSFAEYWPAYLNGFE
ncbi:phosphoadenosine phosphosulfate reductase [Marinifilum sp. JC120]|nr:phosphoadenosine phosphosulfate reductase [Marinifilum sp. JC120]